MEPRIRLISFIKKNSGSWQSYTINETIELEATDTLKFWGIVTNYQVNSNLQSYINTYLFVMTGKIKASGNIMSFINFQNIFSLCFHNLFMDCLSLVDISQLSFPADQMQYGCYANMFNGCSNLIYAPKSLPATNLASYCYSQMFYGCTSLNTTPILPATQLSNGCYNQMFQWCTSLSSAPELPATILSSHCYYQMFNSCSSLNNISVNFNEWNANLEATSGWLANVAPSGRFMKPALLSTVIGDSYIPENWQIYNTELLTFIAKSNNSGIKLTKNGNPDPITLKYKLNTNTEWKTYNINDTISLNNNDVIQFASESSTFSKEDNYYQFIMSGTIQSTGNINSLISYSNLQEYCFKNLFKDCISLTKAPYLPSNTLANHCYDGMFYGCTSLTSTPSLPAMNLANYCYYQMFYGCTSLNNTPYLPAIILFNSCYQQIFYNCSNLNSILVAFTEWPETNKSCTKNWLKNTASEGEFKKPDTLQGIIGDDYIPENWYEIQHYENFEYNENINQSIIDNTLISNVETSTEEQNTATITTTNSITYENNTLTII